MTASEDKDKKKDPETFLAITDPDPDLRLH